MDRTRSKMLWVTIVRLWTAGMPARVISCYTGASISTVYRWIRWWQEKNGNAKGTRRNRGRPRKILSKVMPLPSTPGKILHDLPLPVPPNTEILHVSSFFLINPGNSLYGLLPSTKGLADKPQSRSCPVKVPDVLPSCNSCHGLPTLGLHSTNTLQQHQHPLPTFHFNQYLHSLSLW